MSEDKSEDKNAAMGEPKERAMNEDMMPLDCEEFENLVVDLDRPGTFGMVSRESALAHAETCSKCAQQLTESESLSFRLRTLASESTALVAPSRVEASLLREFRREKALASQQRVRWQIAAMSVAAAVLLALGLWMYRRGGGEKNHAPSVVGNGPTTALATNTPAAASNSTEPATDAAADAANAEDAAQFTPVPGAYDPALLDDGAVVRVEIPRAALASFGLPVEAMEGDGSVRADLIVSADGTPQAIRLVSQNDASQSF
jgi:hypothetical protein